MRGAKQAGTDGAGGRGVRGLWGGLVLAALVAAYWSMPAPVCGQGSSSNSTVTTSTSHHTSAGCPARTQDTVTVTVAFGPTTICIGNDGGDKTPPNCSPGVLFTVAAGTENIDTNVHTETFVCDATAIPTLSEWAWIGMIGLLLAGGVLALRRRPGDGAPPPRLS